MDWLTQAVTGTTGAATTSPDGVLAAALTEGPIATQTTTGEGSCGLDWLAAATALSDNAKTVQRPARTAQKLLPSKAGPAAPGGWMTSGKLGISTTDDSDAIDEGGGSGDGATSGKAAGAQKKTEKTDAAALARSGPGGWLSLGAFGVQVEDRKDEDAADGSRPSNGGRHPDMVSGETQTDDDIEEIVKRGGAPNFPPWAKRWSPPPEPVVKPEPSAESSGVAQARSEERVCKL